MYRLSLILCLLLSSSFAWKPKDIHSGTGDSYEDSFNDRFYMPSVKYGDYGIGGDLPPNGWIYQGDPNFGLSNYQEKKRCFTDHFYQRTHCI